MSTDTIQRSIFKMNPDFWHQRAPPNNVIQNLSMTSPDANMASQHQSSTEDIKYSHMKEFNDMKEFPDIKNYNQKFDDFKTYTEKIYTQQEKFNSQVEKFDKYTNNQEMNEVDKGQQPRSTSSDAAQNLTAEVFKSPEQFTQNNYKMSNRTTNNPPEISPPAASILQNLSTEQLRNIQSTLASFGQANDVRNIQANAIQNLSTHIQNVLPPNALSPNEIRNLQSLAISNLSAQVQSMTNANLNMGDIRNLTTIAVQNLTNHIENLRNQSANLTPNEVRNLSTVAVNNLTNHIQNLNQMNQPIPSGITANELPRNLAAFQQLTNPVQTNLDIRNFTNNLSAMQNLTSLSGMSNNIAAVSAVLSAAAVQQAALSSQNTNQGVQNSENRQPDGVEPEISNGSNSCSAANINNGTNNAAAGGGGGGAAAAASGGGAANSAPAAAAAAGATNNASSNLMVPPGSGSNSNTEKNNSNDLPIFMHKSAMQMHARDLHRSEIKPHQCQQCLKSFSSNHQLVQHIRVHTGEKPYKCSYCDRRFKQLSHVQQHTRLHTGERPYKCHLPECGRAFIQLSNLQQHLRNHDAQVERAKNRPFHCNICGKGFATESSLRTHTSKEQREALMGIPLTSLEPRLHEMSQLGNAHNSGHAALLGSQNAVTCPLCHKLFLGGESLMEHMKHAHKDPNATGVATKRRTANHPCPICGKHYVNEGSLRKHLACHPETSQFSSSLRMWPCSVCQAVFTHESGLLSHMEHMRMDPKHQFAAQYVLSRAAAERRERESLIAAAVAASNAGSFGIGGAGQPVNSLCPSPAPSDSSSIEHLSSTGSENGNIANNNNNNKLDMSHITSGMNAVRPPSAAPQEYNDIPNRMAALNAAIAQAQNMQTDQDPPVNTNKEFMNNQEKFNMESNGLQITPSNLIMRNSPQAAENNNDVHQPMNEVKPAGFNKEMPAPRNDMTPAHAQQLAVNAMRANLENMRNIESLTGIRPGYLENSLTGQQQQNDSVLRIQQQAAEALLRSQAEAALRLAVSQAAAAVSGERNQNNIHNQLSPDLTEALRLQEQRLEQALRLHGDPRVLGFSLNNPNSNSNTNLNSNGNINNT